MSIYGIQPNFIERTKQNYVKKGAKVATLVEQYADKKIESSSTLDFWHKAQAASINWQTKHTPNALFGKHKKLQEKVLTTVEQLGLEPEKPCFSGPDKYDDYIRIGSNWYYTDSFIGAASKLGDQTETFMKDIQELYDKYNDVGLYSCTVEYNGGNPIGDTLNHILESQREKRGY